MNYSTDTRLPRTWLVVLMALFAAAAPLRADEELDKVLAKERWRESAYGVSLRPPLGTTMQSRTVDDAKLRIIKGDDYVISVYIKELGDHQQMTIDQVVRTAIEQFGFAQPTSVIDHQRVAKPAGRPGWIIYFGVNLGVKDLRPEAAKDVEALKKIARTQLETANQLRDKKGKDIEAYRLYKSIASKSPDPVIAKKAKQWADAYEVDRQFMSRFLLDEAARRQRNPIDVDNKPWYMGQALMQLAPNTFVVVQLEVGKENYEAVRPIFESVIKSIEVQNPEELDKYRKELLKAGNAIDGFLTHKRLLEAMLPEVKVPIVDDEGKPAGVAPLRLQYMRVLEAGKDVGWMKTVHRERRDQIVTLETEEVLDAKTGRTKRIRKSVVKEQGINGISCDVYFRIHFGPRAVDSHTLSFLSEDGTYESWSIRTTVRDRKDPDPDAKAKLAPAKGPVKAPDKAKAPAGPQYHVRTWLETGVQNKESITIIREGPSGIDRLNWRKPLDGYITQTELYLLTPLLPVKNAEYGFYAYYPNTGSLSFRTMRVVPDGSAGGGFRIYSRQTPDSPDQVSVYDGKGNLVQRSLGEGRDIVPTTREQLASIWKVDLPDETAVPAKPEDDKPLPPTGRIPR